jgi:hypothetical protein
LQAILKAVADNSVEALAYPTIRRNANVIGETQVGSNCQLSANSGLPAIVVPGGFTPTDCRSGSSCSDEHGVNHN